MLRALAAGIQPALSITMVAITASRRHLFGVDS